jgi:hypothetical protein
MTTGHIYAATRLAAADVLVQLVQATPAAWAYTENENAAEGEYAVNLLRYADLPDASYFSAGRIFDTQRELRWQYRQAGLFDVVYLSEQQPPALDLDWRRTEYEAEDTPHDQFLWGTHVSQLAYGHFAYRPSDEPVWIETRIPRPLVYPVEPAKRVKLLARYYRQNDKIMTTRWCDLQGER